MFDSNLVNLDSIFWFCALVGTALFSIQLALSLFSVYPHHDSIELLPSGLDDSGFKMVSKQALTGFLMVSGWLGLACHDEFHLSVLTSIFFSLAGGLTAIAISILIFKGAGRLRSTGTVFKIEELLGKEAVVYQRIPKEGVGKASVSLDNITYEVDAISQNCEEIASFTLVQIARKVNEQTVAVVPIR